VRQQGSLRRSIVFHTGIIFVLSGHIGFIGCRRQITDAGKVILNVNQFLIYDWKWAPKSQLVMVGTGCNDDHKV
jgi:hypothetical protein